MTQAQASGQLLTITIEVDCRTFSTEKFKLSYAIPPKVTRVSGPHVSFRITSLFLLKL
jgi:hypothetical protein